MPSDDVTRFLTDEDVPVAWARAINKVAAIKELGVTWEATSIHDIGRSGLVDRDQLIYARSNGFVLLTCDRYPHQDGQALRTELLANGGKMIQIRGGPAQPSQEAVAKLLMHFGKWLERAAMKDGIATFQAANTFRFRPRAEFSRKSMPTGREQLTEYESNPTNPRRTTRHVEPPDDQGQLV